jgi:transposase
LIRRRFYEVSLERHVPATHLLRSIDRSVNLSDVRSHLPPIYSSTGRPSVDPELLARMLLVGYCYGIRFERRLCEEDHLNLASLAIFQTIGPPTSSTNPPIVLQRSKAEERRRAV